jgi:hypothetical protein
MLEEPFKFGRRTAERGSNGPFPNGGPMNDRPEYLLDYRFRQLKRLTTHESERGRHYHRGVRTVLAQIEATGRYRPNPLLAYLIDLYVFPDFAAAPHDTAGFATARAFLAEAGWTVEQGYDFARGARLAEHELSDYRTRGDGDTRSAA